jgi:cysteine dioxygenase
MDLIPCITSLFGSLNNPSLKDLRDQLSRIPEPHVKALPYVREPEQAAYGRTVIYRDESIEVILIHLPAYSETSIHDHGVSYGCSLVLEGKVTNILYQELEPGSLSDEIVMMAEHSVFKDGYFYSPRGVIHQMANRTPNRTLSLHVYAPPLENMKVYTVDNIV